MEISCSVPPKRCRVSTLWVTPPKFKFLQQLWVQWTSFMIQRGVRPLLTGFHDLGTQGQ